MLKLKCSKIDIPKFSIEYDLKHLFGMIFWSKFSYTIQSAQVDVRSLLCFFLLRVSSCFLRGLCGR